MSLTVTSSTTIRQLMDARYEIWQMLHRSPVKVLIDDTLYETLTGVPSPISPTTLITVATSHGFQFSYEEFHLYLFSLVEGQPPVTFVSMGS